mmetsp:Transcript_20383/g.44133  ORF Transcript_20383/g.44133 Transcript_20383/m.44133 type:complete len:95 (+) Transcript_20383:2118-2402(+)
MNVLVTSCASCWWRNRLDDSCSHSCANLFPSNFFVQVHGEMYALTRNLTLMESKMFKPIMDQLDWAFKLHREDSSKSSGGFVTVARGGFVSVAH